MPDTATTASSYRYALLMGLVETREVLSWLEREIEATENPSSILVDAALALNKEALLSGLRDLDTGADQGAVKRSVFQRVADRAAASQAAAEDMAEQLYGVVLHHGLPVSDSERDFIIGIGDEFSLAASGTVGSPRSVHSRFLSFLRGGIESRPGAGA